MLQHVRNCWRYCCYYYYISLHYPTVTITNAVATCVCVYQLELPLYETAMQKMRSLARAVLSGDDKVEEQIEFIRQSVTQLLKARHVLKCSYVYGYYLEQTGYKKPIFECMQVPIGFPCFVFFITILYAL